MACRSSPSDNGHVYDSIGNASTNAMIAVNLKGNNIRDNVENVAVNSAPGYMEMRKAYEGATTNNNPPYPVNEGNLRDAGYMDMKGGVQYESNFSEGCPGSVPNDETCDDQDDVYVIKSVSRDGSRVNYVNAEEWRDGEDSNDIYE